MAEQVQVIFRFALGQWVRWAAEPFVRWRVLERWYLDGAACGPVSRYLLQSASDTQRTMADETHLAPWENTDVPARP